MSVWVKLPAFFSYPGFKLKFGYMGRSKLHPPLTVMVSFHHRGPANCN